MEKKITYEWLKNRELIIYEVISGSIAYGTNLPTSDEDRRYVYILPIEYILSGNIIDQVNDETNDVVGYEIGKFLNLIKSGNPNLLELLNMPERCIIHKDPIFDLILDNKEKFITKICAKSFGGYAKMQISKAVGQDKKQNWEKDKVTRKDILDFVYVIEDGKSILWKQWNAGHLFEEEFCGVVNIPNVKDVYAVYYDNTSDNPISAKLNVYMSSHLPKLPNILKLKKPLNYKGMVKVAKDIDVGFIHADGTIVSTQLRLSSVPKGEVPICNIFYNQEGFSRHCKDYKSYQTWLAERNDARWVDVESHGQKIDGKNMMHCRRLLDMSREIAMGKGINVFRENASELIDIRKGKVDLKTLIEHASNEIVEIDRLFEESNLPNEVDSDFVDGLLTEIRKNLYKI